MILTSIATLFLTSPALAAPKVCATPAEYEAFNMRALQSELMVAALGCKQTPYYNRFMQQYQPQMHAYSESLQGFFRRHGSADPATMTANYITLMANRASKASLSRPQQEYCQQTGIIYHALSQGKLPEVTKLANQFYSSWHKMPVCDAAS